jgi:hypothetical protein
LASFPLRFRLLKQFWDWFTGHFMYRWILYVLFYGGYLSVYPIIHPSMLYICKIPSSISQEKRWHKGHSGPIGRHLP